MNKTVDTEICEVTVYSDQALVKRRGVVQLTGEEQELVIARLPTTLLSESVQVSAVGKAGVRIVGVRTEQRVTTEATHPKMAQLTEDIRQLEEQKTQGQDLLTLLNLQRNFVKNLSNQYLERLTKSQNPEPLDLNQLKDLLEFVGEQWGTVSSAIAQQDKDQKQVNNQLQALRSQQQQLTSSRSQEHFNIIVTLEPLGAGELELEVSYLVTPASWQPFYDLSWQGTSQTVNLSYLAEVTQTTGEDWLGVALTLSTAQLQLDTLSPQLSPWYIDLQQPREHGSRSKSENSPPRTSTITMPFAGIAPEPEATIDEELERLNGEKVTVEASKQRSIVTFSVNSRSTIPSDDASHKTRIFSNDYPCRPEYIAMPRRVNFAYLQVTITNPLTGVTLLPGQVHLFRNNTFIGTTQIENIAPGQEFKINLGIDEGLKIERNLVERLVDKKQVGNQRRVMATYAYRLTITNLHNQPVDVKVIEQLPVSCHSQLKVRLTDTEPPMQMGEMGVLEGSITLSPSSFQELYYQFTVEHPPELKVVGLDI